MIARILILLLLLLLLPTYIWWKMYWQGKRKKWGVGVVMGVNVCMSLLLCYVALYEGYSMSDDRLKQQLLTLTLLIGIPQLVMALLLGAGSRLKKKKHTYYIYVGGVVVLGAMVFGGLLYGFTKGSSRVEVHEERVAIKDLPPAFEGYRIALIADWHLGTLLHRPEVVHHVVDVINAQQVDAIMFVGDLVNYRAEELLPFVSELSRLDAVDGVWSVMGNHDYMTYLKWASGADSVANIRYLQTLEREMGWKVLLNEHDYLRRGGDSLLVVGLENQGNRGHFPREANRVKALHGVDAFASAIVLQHDPTYWRDSLVGDERYALMLAGHTHAMQFQIGNWSPAQWFYPEWKGLYRADTGQQLYVTPGVGEVLLPFRWGAWAEIDVLTLVSGN